MIIQRKILQGQQRPKEWKLDTDTIKRCVEWARRSPGRLQEEVEAMASEDLGFPEFITTVGSQLGAGGNLFSYGMLAECRQCGNLLIFEDGLRCISCGSEQAMSSGILLAYVGKVPCKIGTLDASLKQTSGGPFLSSIMSRMKKMIRKKEKGAFQNYFFTLSNGDTFFSPPVYIFFPRNWPRSAPYVLVYKTYFNILKIPIEHVYPKDKGWYRLCLYASWREETKIKDVLKNRVVPRVYIDLMIADVVAAKRLNDFERALGTSLHDAYNMVGRHGSEIFERVYFNMIGQR